MSLCISDLNDYFHDPVCYYTRLSMEQELLLLELCLTYYCMKAPIVKILTLAISCPW